MSIQTNFEKLFATRKVDIVEQLGSTPATPPNQKGSSVPSVKPTQQPVRPVGTGSLHDAAGKELNLDGTPKLPYHHPHFGQVTTAIPQLPASVEAPAKAYSTITTRRTSRNGCRRGTIVQPKKEQHDCCQAENT